MSRRTAPRRSGPAGWLALLGVLGVIGALYLRPRPAQAAPALQPLLQKIDRAQQGVRSLTADFVQRNRVKLFRQEIQSRGRLRYQRTPAARLRWEYLAPDPSTLLLLARKAYLLLPGQAARTFDLDRDPTMRAIFTEMELWLGQGALKDAGTHYEVQAGGTDAAPVVVLVPRPSTPLSKAFARIELRPDPRTYLLRGLLLVERGGDEKEITFTRVEVNGDQPAELFQLR